MSYRQRATRPVCLGILAGLMALGGSAAAQIPDDFTNLEILPKDIGKRELVSMMREFAGALGVRCKHGLAERLARERDDTEGAIAVMELNVERHPEAAYSHLMLGQLYPRNGDKAAAIKSTERAVELEPDNAWAKNALEQLRTSE